MCKNTGKKNYSLSCTHQYQCSCSCLEVTRSIEWTTGQLLRFPCLLVCVGLKRKISQWSILQSIARVDKSTLISTLVNSYNYRC